MEMVLLTALGVGGATVIGSHAGPGTLALFFMGKEK